jgi:4-hydroxybenzoate polyprenyltransferase
VRTFRNVQALNLVLLGLLAGLIVAQLLGVGVPILLVVAVLAASLALRTYRDLVWGGEAGRRRLPFNLLIGGLIIYLLLFATPR